MFSDGGFDATLDKWITQSEGRSLSVHLMHKLEAAVISFPTPAESHATCGLSALRAPAHFGSRVMRLIGLARLGPADATIVKQTEYLVKPPTVPPLPAEAPTHPGFGQVTSNFCFDPVANEGGTYSLGSWPRYFSRATASIASNVTPSMPGAPSLRRGFHAQ
jgi:hypothetical protein